MGTSSISPKRKTQLEWHTEAFKYVTIDSDVFESFRRIWWMNPHNPTSLRLTPSGYQWFTGVMELTPHVIVLEKQIITFKHLLQLEEVFSDPYHFRGMRLEIFGSTDALMLELYGRDLAAYLSMMSSK